MPKPEDVDLTGLDRDRFEQAQTIDREAWKQEVAEQASLFAALGAELPEPLALERQQLLGRL